MKLNHRKNIYYWKSDRPYVDGNVQGLDSINLVDLEKLLRDYLIQNFKKDLMELQPAGGQGNHITYLAFYPADTYFIRVENGPEKDDYMDVESAVLRNVNSIGIPSPKVFHSDNTRSRVPFAIQVIEYIECKDLNVLDKEGELDIITIAESIGHYLARWQIIRPQNFGLFDASAYAERNLLIGFHKNYSDYFLLNWDKHLDYLQNAGFLNNLRVAEIRELVKNYGHLLNIPQGCLVHKDLALWNILGSSTQIKAFIDWSDAISGDDMDDLSLLGCFHTGQVLEAALKGYSLVKPLPEYYEEKLWLHLLRNIIFKAVIRVRGNYFNKPGSFFMNNTNSGDLRTFTLKRIQIACEGLKGNKKIQDL
jgi:fructosamine-3-kinase